MTGAALTELVGHCGRMAAISFSPDGRSILSASYHGLAKIWDAEHRRDMTFLPEERSSIGMRPMFSPDGMYVATATATPSPNLIVRSAAPSGVRHAIFELPGLSSCH